MHTFDRKSREQTSERRRGPLGGPGSGWDGEGTLDCFPTSQSPAFEGTYDVHMFL